MSRHRWGRIVGCAVILKAMPLIGWAQTERLQTALPTPVHFPKPKGAVFSLPHVSIILNDLPLRQLKAMRLEVDGKPVPDEAISGCRICAGDKPAVLTAKAVWTVTDGAHQLVITGNDEQGNPFHYKLRYVLDSSTPALGGLTGEITLPNAHVAFTPSVRWGIGQSHRGQRHRLWLGITGGTVLPLEVAGDIRFADGRWRNGGASWKLAWMPSNRWGFSIGQQDGDGFAVFGFRTQPNYFSVAVGFGTSDLPSAWLSGSYSLSHFTQRIKSSPRYGDFLAVLDLVRLQWEVDNKGHVNFGANLCHPYGWRIGVHRMGIGRAKSAWLWQVSLSVRLR